MMDSIDLQLGRRLRSRRRLLNLTQRQVADALNQRFEGEKILFQTVQKYESTANRMSAARVWQLAEILEVPVSYFYEGLGQQNTIDKKPEPSEIDTELLTNAQIHAPVDGKAEHVVVSFAEAAKHAHPHGETPPSEKRGPVRPEEAVSSGAEAPRVSVAGLGTPRR